MGVPLAPVHVCAAQPLSHLSIKDSPIVIASPSCYWINGFPPFALDFLSLVFDEMLDSNFFLDVSVLFLSFNLWHAYCIKFISHDYNDVGE